MTDVEHREPRERLSPLVYQTLVSLHVLCDLLAEHVEQLRPESRLMLKGALDDVAYFLSLSENAEEDDREDAKAAAEALADQGAHHPVDDYLEFRASMERSPERPDSHSHPKED